MGVAFLSTAVPTWNNWARNNPSWVVVMLELERHLARLQREQDAVLVGQPITITLQQGIDQVDVDFVLPPDERVVQEVASIDQNGNLATAMKDTYEPGTYKARWQTVSGARRELVTAVNINPIEGNLERVSLSELPDSLPGIPFSYDRANDLEPRDESRGGTSLVRPLLLILFIVLVCEQILGYAVSYHRTSKRT
jgi:hypothetical protein